MDKIKEAFKNFFGSKSMVNGSISFALIGIVIVIAVLVNVVFSTFAAKTTIKTKWDLSRDKIYSIGDTTKDILKNLKNDVTIYGLFDPEKTGRTDSDQMQSGELEQLTQLLNNYAGYSHVKVVYKDPDKNPGFINEIDPTNTQKLQKDQFLVKSGNKAKKLTYDDLFQASQDPYTQQSTYTLKGEQAITAAIKYVTSDKTPTVYFTEGHNESKLDTDYVQLKKDIEYNNFAVKTINLFTEAKVPDDAEILVIASPKSDINSKEKTMISDFLKNGGRAMFLFDPGQKGNGYPRLEEIMKDYGISINYDQVQETDGTRADLSKPFDFIPDLQNNEINQGLNPGSFGMIMLKSRSLNIIDNPRGGLTVKSLLKSSSNAIGKQFDSSVKDLKGPLDLAIASQYDDGSKSSKLVVIGSSTFMSDAAIKEYGDGIIYGENFFLSSMYWMHDAKDDVIIASKDLKQSSLVISPLSTKIMQVLVLAIIPLFIMGIGLWIWLRRRHL